MSSDNQPENSGRRSGIAGKAFALASAVALCVPLLGVGQLFGLVPGNLQSDHYADMQSLADAFSRPAYSQTVEQAHLVPLNYRDHYFGDPYAYRDNQLGDTAISFKESAASLGAAGVLGAVGSAFADVSQRRKVGDSTVGVFSVAGHAGMAITDSFKPLLPLLALGSLGGPGSNVAKGAAAGLALVLASVVIAVPTTLSVNAVYDNFIREPEKAPKFA